MHICCLLPGGLSHLFLGICCALVQPNGTAWSFGTSQWCSGRLSPRLPLVGMLAWPTGVVRNTEVTVDPELGSVQSQKVVGVGILEKFC